METMPMVPDIEFTDAARSQALKVLSQEAGDAAGGGIRLSVRQAGCSGYEYVMAYAPAPEAGDLVRHFDGFDLYVDDASYAAALKGVRVDFQQDLLSSAFVFINPNKKGECGCGISFTV
jgi:iron-sulfur cluster assembly protein